MLRCWRGLAEDFTSLLPYEALRRKYFLRIALSDQFRLEKVHDAWKNSINDDGVATSDITDFTSLLPYEALRRKYFLRIALSDQFRLEKVHDAWKNSINDDGVATSDITVSRTSPSIQGVSGKMQPTFLQDSSGNNKI